MKREKFSLYEKVTIWITLSVLVIIFGTAWYGIYLLIVGAP